MTSSGARPIGRARSHVASGSSTDTRLMFWVALGIAVLPLLVDGVRAIQGGWQPHRDSAFVELRVHDVFTHQTPLVGMPAGGLHWRDAYHLGPLEFWLLAVPYRLAGLRTAGTIVGLLAWNAGVVAAIALVARRLGGPVFAIAALLVTTVLVWSVGAGLAHNPFNPAFGILPILLMVLLVPAIAHGDIVLLPVFAFVASVIAQTHLSYFGLTVVVVGLGAIATGFALRRRGRLDTSDRSVLLVTAGVLAFCWSGPLVQPLAGAGSNMLKVLGTLGASSGRRAGLRFGATLTSRVAALPPPFGLRGHPFQDTLATSHHLRASVLVRLAVVSASTAALLVATLRGRRWWLVFVVATAAVTLLGAFVTVSETPLEGGFAAFTGVHYAWLMWPVAAAFWILLTLALVELYLRRWRESLLAAIVLTVILVPVSVIATGRREPEWLDTKRAVEVALVSQITDRVRRELPSSPRYRLVLEPTSVATLIGPGVTDQLENHGYRLLIETADSTVARLYTPHRRYRGQTVSGTLYVVLANAGVRVSGVRILLRTGEHAVRQLEDLTRRMKRVIDDAGGVHLSAKGELWWSRGKKLYPTMVRSRYLAADDVLSSDLVSFLYAKGYVASPRISDATLSRWRTLRAQVANRYVVSFQPARSGT